jgi:hypothetical protein
MSKKNMAPAQDRPPSDTEVEARIREFFANNYNLLRQEGGHVLAEGARQQALEQVLHYWRKLKDIATTVTDTEVKLSLPGQVTPKGRQFVIEGVVDIVRDGEHVWMYDLKTHVARDVRAEPQVYQDQLNVYAYIWTGIRGQRLDGTAVIATALPPELRDALRLGDVAIASEALAAWDPVVTLPFDEGDVQRTIDDFGRCVDGIEDAEFAAPPVEALARSRRTRHQPERRGSRENTTLTFAQIHCQTCDARFSCAPYRDYQERYPTQRPVRGARRLTDDAAERELDAWIADNLGD